MSVPEGTGARRPLRTGGLALLGLAAVAGLIGLVLVVTDAGETSADGRLPATSGPAPAPQSPVPSPSPSRPPATTTTSSPPPTIPATPAPGASAPPGPASPPGSAPAPVSPAPAPVSPVPGPVSPAPAPPGPRADERASDKGYSRGELRVYNNSTIRGLAARAADDFTAAGWTVAEVGNYPGGRIWTTTMYYQEGAGQRALAEALAAQFGMRVEPRFAGIANARPGMIVIVTNDYGA